MTNSQFKSAISEVGNDFCFEKKRISHIKYRKILIIVLSAFVILSGMAVFAIAKQNFDQENREKRLKATYESDLPDSAADFFSSDKWVLTYEKQSYIFSGETTGNTIEYKGGRYRCTGTPEHYKAYRILSLPDSLKILSCKDLPEISFKDSWLLIEQISPLVETSEIGYSPMEYNYWHGCVVHFYKANDKTVAIIWYALGAAGSERKDVKAHIVVYDDAKIAEENLSIPPAGVKIDLENISKDIKSEYLDTLIRVVEDSNIKIAYPDGNGPEKGTQAYIDMILSGFWF